MEELIGEILHRLEQDGFDTTNCDSDKLCDALYEEGLNEYGEGFMDVVWDLHDSIGLKEFGIVEEDNC